MNNREARKARRTAFAASLADLRGLVPAAVEMLRAIVSDPSVPPQARIAAARVILDHAARSWDLSQQVEPASLEEIIEDLAV